MFRILPTTSPVVTHTVELPPPPSQHLLSIASNPSGVGFTLDGSAQVTPFSAQVLEGPHTIAMAPQAAAFNLTYSFFRWMDGVTSDTRILDLTGDVSLYAMYVSSGVVAGDAGRGGDSLAMVGGANLYIDVIGRKFAFYTDAQNRLSVAVNPDPLQDGWLPPFKSAATGYIRPAAIFLMPSGQFKILLQGPSSTIVDIDAAAVIDTSGDVINVLFTPPARIDTDSRVPSAIRAHDGSIWAVWNRRVSLSFSSVIAGHWTASSGWTLQEVIRDTVDTGRIQPNIMERLDNLKLYVVGNRDQQVTNKTMVFNSATFSNGVWTWGIPNLTWRTNISRGIPDAPDMLWDETQRAVVIVHDIAGVNAYRIVKLDANDVLTSEDTPILQITNNEWGTAVFNNVTGDLWIFFMDTGGGATTNGRLGYTRRTAGIWSPFTLVDGDTSNIAIAARKTHGPPEILYAKGLTAPAQILYRRL